MSDDPVRMLRAAIGVLRRHRRQASGDRWLWDCYREGLRHWRSYYGPAALEFAQKHRRTRGLRLTGWRETFAIVRHAHRTTRPARMIIWAVGTTRNEADIIRANVLHHQSQGVSHFLWLDNGSTDGTTDVLDELRQSVSLEWRLHTDSFRQDVLLTALAREAFVRGADWVLPLDADEFWYAPQGSLRQVLKRTDAGALRVQLVNFVQRRDQLTAAAAGLLTMNRRPPEPIGPIDRLEELVNSRRIGFVEILYPAKWIARTCPLLEVGWGNHTLYGSLAPAVDTDAIVCLHAPLRSRATLENKVDSGRRFEDVREDLREAWHVRRLETR